MPSSTHLVPASLCFTPRTRFSWIVLTAVMLLGSTPVLGQRVQYSTESPAISTALLEIEPGEETSLPLHYGMPALRNRMPEIAYPPRAEQFQVEGRVLVEFVVNEKGRVARSKILKGLGYDCDEEVLRVLRGARFHPVLDASGQPQEARYVTAFDFSLDS